MQTKRIIVADDEAHIRHIVSMKLENAGFEVHVAIDGEEALELCRAQPPDLLITDYQMPLMSGLELCRHLRADDATRRIPVILLTARGFDLTEQETEGADISAIMSKPFSPREVLLKVGELLETTMQTR